MISKLLYNFFPVCHCLIVVIGWVLWAFTIVKEEESNKTVQYDCFKCMTLLLNLWHSVGYMWLCVAYVSEHFGHVMSICRTHGPLEKPLVIVHNYKHVSESLLSIALLVQRFNEEKKSLSAPLNTDAIHHREPHHTAQRMTLNLSKARFLNCTKNVGYITNRWGHILFN